MAITTTRRSGLTALKDAVLRPSPIGELSGLKIPIRCEVLKVKFPIKTSKFIWMDGKLVRWKDAKVHVLTHAIHYGSAVFEGIHSYKTKKGVAIFRLDAHMDRLFKSAKALDMKIRFAKKQLESTVKKLVKINKIGDGYIRPLAYY